MNNVYPVTSTRRRKGAARGRESNVLPCPSDTSTRLFKTMTSKVAILLYVAIFSVFSQSAMAQCATSATLTPQQTTYCIAGGSTNTTVTFTVSTTPTDGLYNATVNLYRNGNATPVNTVVAGPASNTITITDPMAPVGVNGYDIAVFKTGCSNVVTPSQATIVTVQAAPQIRMGTSSQTICSGQTPSFNVIITGPTTGTLSFTYVNVNTGTPTTVTGIPANSSGTTNFTVTPSPSPVQTTTYSLTTVSSSTGCNTGAGVVSGQGTHTVTVNNRPQVGNLGTPQPVCQGGTLLIEANPSGAIATPTYRWYKNNVALTDGATGQGSTISGAGTPTLTITNAQPSDAGQYYFEVCSPDPQYNACGNCAQTNVVTAVVNPLPTATLTPSTANGCIGNAQTFTVNFTGTQPFNYTWQRSGPGGTVTQTVSNINSNSNTITFTPTQGGTYTYSILRVQDANCVNSINNASTATLTVSDFAVTMVPPSGQTQTVCFGGTASRTFTRANSATTTYSYSLQGPATAAGTASNTNFTINNLPAGNYTLTSNDGSCTAITSFSIASYGQIEGTAATTAPIRCNGGTTSVTATLTRGDAGAYTITIASATHSQTAAVTKLAAGTQSPVSTTFQNVPAGNYNVTFTNSATNCSFSTSLTVLEPAPINVTATPGVASLTCNGETTVINTSFTGGNTSSFYTYALTGGPSAQTRTSTATSYQFTNVAAGNYLVTVTDANGCTGTRTVNITQPAAMTGSATAQNATCNAGTGSVQFTNIAGGTAPYRYSISGSAAGASAATNSTTFTYSNVAPGTYTATVIDANNCAQVLGIVTVTAPPAISATVTPGQIQCNGGSTSITITNIAGGNGNPITFTLNGPTGSTTFTSAGGATTTTFFPVTAGNYSLTAANTGCPQQNLASFTITEPAPIVVTTSKQDIRCNGGTGTATVSATAGGATLTYQLFNANTSQQVGQTVTNNTGSATFGNLPAGTYNYVVTNPATGCTAQSTPGQPSTQITITNPSSVSVGTVTNTSVTCFGGSNGTISIRPSGGTGTYTVTATGPNSYTATRSGTGTITFTGLFAGTYTLSVVDANGCPSSTGAVTTTTVAGGTQSGTGAPDLILASQANTNTFPTTGSSVTITYGISNPSGNAATGVVLRVQKPTPDYTITLSSGVTGWTMITNNSTFVEFRSDNQISCGQFAALQVPVIVTRTAAATGKGDFPITGYVYSSVQDANEADNSRVDRFNAQ